MSDADAVLAGDRCRRARGPPPSRRRRRPRPAPWRRGRCASKVTSGWKLPSPAWPITGMAVSVRARRWPRPPTSSSGIRGIGHADVLDQHRAEPLDARDGHAPRPHEQLALVEVVGDGDVGRAAPPRRRRRSPRASSPPASVLGQQQRAASRVEAHRPHPLDRGDGGRGPSARARPGARRPRCAVTARPASTTSANVATMVVAGGGGGRSRRVASVITPSVPSDPTNSRLRS